MQTFRFLALFAKKVPGSTIWFIHFAGKMRPPEYELASIVLKGPTVLPDSVGGSLAVNVVILVLADREDVMTFHAVILQVAVFICIRDRFRLDVYE